MAELSRYQRQVVKNYYENLDTALVQRLGEQETELYQDEGKKRTIIWGCVAKWLEKLDVAQSKIDRIVASDDAQQLAKLLQELWG